MEFETPQTWFHGTKASLAPGDLIAVGHPSNFADGRPLAWVYFTATMDAAIWGADLARGDGRGRVYVVEPTGDFVDDPNLTDRKYPGNPTRSYRSRAPLRVLGEVTGWTPHDAEVVARMKARIAELARDPDAIID